MHSMKNGVSRADKKQWKGTELEGPLKSIWLQRWRLMYSSSQI